MARTCNKTSVPQERDRLPNRRSSQHDLATLDPAGLRRGLARRNSTGRSLLACMPPTRVAATTTASGLFFSKNSRTFSGVAQIQFIMCPNDDIPVAVLLKVAKQRTSYQTPVAGYIDGSKRHRTSLVQVICTGVKLGPSIPVRSPTVNFDSACSAHLST
jgi:hypothetical protein